MKKLKVLFFLILILPSIGYTQEKPSTMATIVNLIKARKNEFADIKGALFTANKENNTEYYQGKQSFGAKTEALIYEKDKNRSRFLSYFDYNDTAELLKATAIIDDVIKTINIIAGNGPNSVYKSYDYKTTDGDDVTEITDNDNGFLVMQITSGKKYNAFSLVIFGALYGKP